MFDLNRIKLTSERNKKAVKLQPALARGTNTAKAQLGKNLHFDIDVDGVKIAAEVPQAYGGNGTGPGSSAHALASLICCTMVGYLIKFAERDIPVSGLAIQVEGDWDTTRQYGYTDVRYVVDVDSDASADDVRQAIEAADARSFGLSVFQQPVKTHREVRVNPTV